MPHVAPATHEAKGHLYYHPRPGDRYDGLDPYWTVGSLLINEFDGYTEIEATIDDEPVLIELAYSKSGFAPRAQDDVTERLYEFELHVDGQGERKCHYNLSPRFQDLQHYKTGESISVPFDHLDADEGVTVQFQAANVDLEEIPRLLPRALRALAAAAGTSFRRQYFQKPRGGRIEELERYVRITRDWNRKLVQQSGLFDRLAMLLASEEGTKGKRTWDNTEHMAYHHQVRFCPTSAGKVIPEHSRGRQLKSYLPESPDSFDEDDSLYHPKLGALFRKSLNLGRSVRWDDRRELVDSLDESLVNALSWTDIPVDVGGDTSDGDDQELAGGSNGVFVADEHFQVVPREESIPVFEDPCPRLEAEQDHLLMTVLRDMTDSDTELVEMVATDGGQDVHELAGRSGYSLSTIYRALQRLDGILENREGHVRFVSQKIAEEIRAIVQSAEHAIKSAADRAAKLFDIDVNQSSNSAISRWLAEYGAEFIPPDGPDEQGKIRIDTLMSELKSRPQPYLPEALQYLIHAWITDGRRRVDVENLMVDVELASGEHYCAPVRALR